MLQIKKCVFGFILIILILSCSVVVSASSSGTIYALDLVTQKINEDGESEIATTNATNISPIDNEKNSHYIIKNPILLWFVAGGSVLMMFVVIIILHKNLKKGKVD